MALPSKERDQRVLKKMLLYSVPLMPNAIFWWVGTSVNRFFITSMLGIGASGLFAAASKIRVRCIPYILFSCGIGTHAAHSLACLIAAAEKIL